MVERDAHVLVLAPSMHAGKIGHVVSVDSRARFPVAVQFADDYENTYAFRPDELEKVSTYRPVDAFQINDGRVYVKAEGDRIPREYVPADGTSA